MATQQAIPPKRVARNPLLVVVEPSHTAHELSIEVNKLQLFILFIFVQARQWLGIAGSDFKQYLLGEQSECWEHRPVVLSGLHTAHDISTELYTKQVSKTDSPKEAVQFWQWFGEPKPQYSLREQFECWEHGSCTSARTEWVFRQTRRRIIRVRKKEAVFPQLPKDMLFVPRKVPGNPNPKFHKLN